MRVIANRQTSFTPLPLELGWTKEKTLSPYDFIASNFLDVDDPLTNFSGWTKAAQFGTTTETASSGTVEIEKAGSGAAFSLYSRGTARPTCGCIQVDVSAHATSGAYAVLAVGIGVTFADLLWAELDLENDTVQIVQRVGSVQTNLASVSHSFAAAFTVSVGYINNQVEVRIYQSGAWTRVATATQTAHTMATLSSFTWLLGASFADSGNSVTLDEIRAGSYGHTGLRDQVLVTEKDGKPYVTAGGKYLFTMSCAGPNSDSHLGLFEWDLSTRTLSLVASLLVEISSAKYALIGSSLMWDDDASTWRLFCSGFGAPGSVGDGIRMATNATATLSGVVTFTGATQLTLPLGASGAAAYDPVVYHDGSAWRMGYCITNELDFLPESYYPAVATSSDLSSWTAVDQDTTQSACEGVKWAKMAGVFYLFCATRSTLRVYDNALNYLGAITDFDSVASDVSPPHVVIFPTETGGNTDWWALQFDGTRFDAGVAFTWGNIEVFDGSPTQSGAEWGL